MGTWLSFPRPARRAVACLVVAAALLLMPLAGSAQKKTAAAQAAGAEPRKPLLGDDTDGSRARPVHAIPLRDPEGEVIRPTDRPLLPFSTTQTCGADCHDVGRVSRGWHFNIAAPSPAGGRRGEPWILVDPETATQVPLSYHGWPGTFNPAQVGLSPLQFAVMFGGRTPGGLSGASERAPDQQTRWNVSGALEPNCLACHDQSPAYDHGEYGRQVVLENFRWAAASASGIALVTGSAKQMPNTFDYLMPSVEDGLADRMPSVAYAPERFLPGAKMVFDIARDVPARRCYFCHTNVDVAHLGQGRVRRDEDIHLAHGMTCVDCHRNGLDHAMNRGYEKESGVGPDAASLTCRGCHMASEADRNFANGRFGAPYPKHAGLPPIHFTKLSCTACHSGPLPERLTRQLKTSQAHRLAGLNVNKAPEALPHLYSPVFVQQADGSTAPYRLLWPAFWGRMNAGSIEPLPPDRVRQVMAKARVAVRVSPTGDWPALDDATIARVLGLLASEARGTRLDPAGRDKHSDPRPPTADPFVFAYVAGGKLHRLDLASAKLVAEEHPAAQPYTWAVAHDVRPASLALGARGCTDCHDENAAIFFGRVKVDSPLVAERSLSWAMSRFQKSVDLANVATFARTWQYRPWLKGGVGAAAGVLMLFLLAYIFAGVQRVSAATATCADRGQAGRRWLRLLANVVGLACVAMSAATGVPALLSGQKLTGFALILHVASVPAFAVGAVLTAIFWCQRNAFAVADWNRLRHPLGRARHLAATSYFALLGKLFFWVALAASLPAIASATLAMFRLLPSIDQNVLFVVHRYAVAVLLVSAALFVVCAVVDWVARLLVGPTSPTAAYDSTKEDART